MISTVNVRPAILCAKPQRVQKAISGSSRRFPVVCATVDDESVNDAAPVVEAAQPVVGSTPAPPSPPQAAPKPSIGEAMAFSGQAPEIINGRLAMLGFVAALGAELSSQESIFQQIADGPKGLIALTFVLFSIASLVPILKGTKREAFGFFTPNAEQTNGRAAMIGFAALLITEAVSRGAFF